MSTLKPLVFSLRALKRNKNVLSSCLKALHSGSYNYQFLSARSSTFSVKSRGYADTYFTRKHEYVVMETDSIGRIGVSDYAQEKLGDVVYVQLPDVDSEVDKDDEVAAVESVKAASEIYSPLTGKVVEVNELLESECSLVNKSAMEEGWIFKLSLSKKEELKLLMNETEYQKFVEEDEAEDKE